MDDWWLAPMRQVFGSRRVVLAGAVAAAWTEHIAVLRAAGATDFLVVANGRGAGELPDVRLAISDGGPHRSPMESIRADERFLADPPPEIIAAIDAFDPDGDAVVVGTFLNANSHLAGRAFLGHRRPEWVALEDKVVVDAFWDRAGIARQPSVIAPVDEAAAAATGVDRGAGTVWSADARDGFHGGASRTAWVADEESERAAMAHLQPVCDRVRIMPFLDGIPCSIHGIVLPDGVVVLRPVELVTLRRGREFVYAGCATYWDPPSAQREQMRSIARRVGERLADEVDYRGTFTVDGVATTDGFWPTELNPRFGAGINTIARASGVPVLLVHELVAAGRELGRTAEAIEAELLARADIDRGGGTWLSGLSHHADPNRREFDGHAVTVGSGFVRCVWNPAVMPVGPSTAPLACDFWARADREFGTAVGPLTPAPDLVRP